MNSLKPIPALVRTEWQRRLARVLRHLLPFLFPLLLAGEGLSPAPLRLVVQGTTSTYCSTHPDATIAL